MNSLAGKRIVVTRPLAQADHLCRALRALHAHPILFPTIEVTPIGENPQLERAFAEWTSFDWVVFTSVNGVTILFDAAEAAGATLDSERGRPAYAAIGPATARAIETRGGTVRHVPEEFVAEAIVRTLGDVSGKRILLPRAKKARKILADQFKERGADVVEVATYDAVPPSPPPDRSAIVSGEVHAVTFTSSSTVEGFLHLMGEGGLPILERSCVACIGPITAATVRRNRIRVDVVAAEYTIGGLVHALESHFSDREGGDDERT